MPKRIVLPLICGLVVAFWLGLPSRSTDEPKQEVVVVVHKSSSVTDLSLADARRIFLGEKSVWPGGKHINVLMLAPGRSERAVILREIYRMTDAEYSRYFLQAAFTGRVSAPPKDASSAAQMKQWIAEIPGAVGYLSKNDVDDTVKAVLKLP